MDIRKLQRAIVDGLEDVKGQDIVVFNTEHLSALFERVVVASGTSNRQTKALAASVRDAVRDQGGRILSVEGIDNGEWIIVDCGQAVVHIMQPAIRQYYHLEEIWGGKPVKMKLASEARGLVKASEDDEDDEPAPKRKASARKQADASGEPKTPGRKPAAKKVTATKTAADGKVVAKKAPARKKAAEPSVIKTIVIKPGAGNKVVARKVAAEKAAAKRAPARRTPIKVEAAGAPARKTSTRAPARKTTRAS
jgi:ribosome-associated protein